MALFPTSRPALAALTATAVVVSGIPVMVTATSAQASYRPTIVASTAPIFDAVAARYGVRNSGSVRNLQRVLINRRLATAGLRRAGVTGAYLSQTRDSVRLVQRRLGYHGAAADGILGASSARYLGLRWRTPTKRPSAQSPNRPIAQATAASTAAPIFDAIEARYGVRNSGSVRNLQRALITRRFATPGLRRCGVTGAYLSQTQASVRLVQTRLGYRGADADGILGASSARFLGLRWRTPTPQPAAPATPAPTNPSSPGAQLSPVALKNVLFQAGFREPAIRTAWALAMRESGGYPAIVGPPNSNGTRDHGLFQINDVHRSYVDFTRIYDALYNAQVAYSFTRGGVDFSAWGLGTTGWAGQLKAQYPAYWAMLRDRMLEWRAKYPG